MWRPRLFKQRRNATPRKGTLVREVLITQLVFAAVVGTIAIGSVAWVASWVMRDNLGDWSLRWINELEALGAKVVATGCDTDGARINDRCGATHPEAIVALAGEHGCVGISLDGDADRCMLVDEDGRSLAEVLPRFYTQWILLGCVVGFLVSTADAVSSVVQVLDMWDDSLPLTPAQKKFEKGLVGKLKSLFGGR